MLTRFSKPLIVATCLTLASICTSAFAQFKCVTENTITYQQMPCPADHIRKQPTVGELNAERQRQLATSVPRKAVQTVSDTHNNLGLPTASGNTAIGFTCDGRMYCSQMTSCEEAKYFLANCPGVKMDGGRKNGIPCEQQWCRH